MMFNYLMGLFKEEYNKEKEEFNVIGLKSKRKNLRVLEQSSKGKVDKIIDASKKALMPGKRISKNGNIYWETRQNRSDARNSNI